MEIAELVDRLQREKDCYNAMFTALKSEAKPSQYSNLEAIKQIHEQQVEDMQNDYRSARRKLDWNLGELRQQNNQLEFDLRDVKSRYEKLQLKYEHKVKEEHFTQKEFETKYKELETDKNEMKQFFEELLGMLYSFQVCQ